VLINAHPVHRSHLICLRSWCSTGALFARQSARFSKSAIFSSVHSVRQRIDDTSDDLVRPARTHALPRSLALPTHARRRSSALHVRLTRCRARSSSSAAISAAPTHDSDSTPLKHDQRRTRQTRSMRERDRRKVSRARAYADCERDECRRRLDSTSITHCVHPAFAWCDCSCAAVLLGEETYPSTKVRWSLRHDSVRLVWDLAPASDLVPCSVVSVRSFPHSSR
jgi:hypothetical protein